MKKDMDTPNPQSDMGSGQNSKENTLANGLDVSLLTRELQGMGFVAFKPDPENDGAWINASDSELNKPIGTKKTGFSKAELGPFLCVNCVHSNRAGNRCSHPEVMADDEVETDDNGLAIIEPADCCNEFRKR